MNMSEFKEVIEDLEKHVKSEEDEGKCNKCALADICPLKELVSQGNAAIEANDEDMMHHAIMSASLLASVIVGEDQ